MIKVLVDTDLLIDYSKGHSRFLEKLLQKQLKGELELYVNPIVVAEFFTDRGLKDKKKLVKAHEFFHLFGVIDINKKIGLLAGEFLRENRTSFLGDALIAATCICEGLQLATGNKKHFTKVSRLEFYPEAY